MKTIVLLLGLVFFSKISLLGHCQIPCGIYDDEARFALLLENVTTIEKSIAKIKEESLAKVPNYNQIVRWVENKEDHADDITKIITEYFLAQRLKEGQDDYINKLKATHAIIVLSMKAKQSTDEANTEALRDQILLFQKLYAHKH